MSFILVFSFLWSRIVSYSSNFSVFTLWKEWQHQIIGMLSELWFRDIVSRCFSYSYTGVPSDLNRLIRFSPLPELPEKDDSVSTGLFSGSLRLRTALVPKSTATRKAKIPVVTAYMNASSAIRLHGWLSKIRFSITEIILWLFFLVIAVRLVC